MLKPHERGTRVPVDVNGSAVGQLRADVRQDALAFGPKASAVHAGAFGTHRHDYS